MKSVDGFYSIGEILQRPEFINLITPVTQIVEEHNIVAEELEEELVPL